mmetsp:Transcript_18186/g.29547  ORF Transcript_18186/g.29547 Transcript_18186/m.29547 type:complete len:521 (+) Transcript_18186:207-1769(+)|eukprot:CAMPEP_0203748598 /NCGR_PEP_ID=MMETSP0098-20131031/3439_1 /ASSEMBLY_ACC=CAM_ASM_000208 /TAXON_ID=96639 /ORGANISM=" , Strain NY0313808BC1" /LENGTH=520 /DNA_ID=CAMNT_0050637397 /DNA_START=277 /DNA_END=1839 /DNA_ORIENTATION=+
MGKNNQDEGKGTRLGPWLAVGCVAVMAVGLQDVHVKSAVVNALPYKLIAAVEQKTGFMLVPKPQVTPIQVHNQSEMPTDPVQFTLHFNGDGVGEGSTYISSNFKGLNDFIRTACPEVTEIQDIAKEDPTTLERICDPDQGARMFTSTGRRVRSFFDIAQGQRTYLIPQGIQFVWPLSKVGDVTYPEIESPVPGKQMRLRQLTNSPRVFTVENFMNAEEMKELLDANRAKIKPSEVGFSGHQDATRTSSTAWDFTSLAGKKIQKRAFDLANVDFDPTMADAQAQILRYEHGEWYRSHWDYFTAESYDAYDPTVNNGTNRFITVFLYLTDVEGGGHTVFPLSTTHEGYNGEQIAKPNTVVTGIDEEDARYACNTSSSALRSPPIAGNAVIFYSQGPDSSLDPYSLHGGCPPTKGVKWSANIWIYNRPVPDKSLSKDKDKGKDDFKGIKLVFFNNQDKAVELFWDDGTEDMVLQGTIEPQKQLPMNTFHAHKFAARVKGSREVIFRITMDDATHKDKNHVALI